MKSHDAQTLARLAAGEVDYFDGVTLVFDSGVVNLLLASRGQFEWTDAQIGTQTFYGSGSLVEMEIPASATGAESAAVRLKLFETVLGTEWQWIVDFAAGTVTTPIDGYQPARVSYKFSRASGKWADALDGLHEYFEPDTLAATDKGALLELEETYHPTNSALNGMIVGIVGEGGKLADGWGGSVVFGDGTIAIDNITTLNGLTSFTVTWDIENNTGGTIYPNIRFANPATSQGETWTGAIWYDATNNPGDSGINSSLVLQERLADAYLSAGTTTNLTPDGSRQSTTRTLSKASVDNVWMLLTHILPDGQSLKRTADVTMSTLTKSATLSSPMETNDSDVAIRRADVLTLLLPIGTHAVELTCAQSEALLLEGQSAAISVDVVGLPNPYLVTAEISKTLISSEGDDTINVFDDGIRATIDEEEWEGREAILSVFWLSEGGAVIEREQVAMREMDSMPVEWDAAGNPSRTLVLEEPDITQRDIEGETSNSEFQRRIDDTDLAFEHVASVRSDEINWGRISNETPG